MTYWGRHSRKRIQEAADKALDVMRAMLGPFGWRIKVDSSAPMPEFFLRIDLPNRESFGQHVAFNEYLAFEGQPAIESWARHQSHTAMMLVTNALADKHKTTQGSQTAAVAEPIRIRMKANPGHAPGEHVPVTDGVAGPIIGTAKILENNGDEVIADVFVFDKEADCEQPIRPRRQAHPDHG